MKKRPLFEYQSGDKISIHLSKLQKTVSTNGCKTIMLDLERQRCEADIMYRLFRNPVKSGIAKTLLQGLVKFIEHKNQPDLTKSRVYRDARDFMLHHPRADYRVQIFFILLILSHDADARVIVRNAYKPGNLWEQDASQHFDAFIVKLQDLIQTTMLSRFAEPTIRPIIHNLVVKAEQIYLSH